MLQARRELRSLFWVAASQALTFLSPELPSIPSPRSGVLACCHAPARLVAQGARQLLHLWSAAYHARHQPVA